MKDDSDYKREEGGVQKDERSSSQEYSVIVRQFKGKKRITKELKKKSKKTSDYMEFYKHYYYKLSSEHPRWNASQLSQIVKLLWKKKKLASGSKGAKKLWRGKSVSGRVAYRIHKESAGMPR